MTIYLRVSTKPPPNDAKRLLPVDVRRSKTLLLTFVILAGKRHSLFVIQLPVLAGDGNNSRDVFVAVVAAETSYQLIEVL